MALIIKTNVHFSDLDPVAQLRAHSIRCCGDKVYTKMQVGGTYAIRTWGDEDPTTSFYIFTIPNPRTQHLWLPVVGVRPPENAKGIRTWEWPVDIDNPISSATQIECTTCNDCKILISRGSRSIGI